MAALSALLALSPAFGGTETSPDPSDAQSLYQQARLTRDHPDKALALAVRAAKAARTPELRSAAERLVRDIRLDLGDVSGAVAAVEGDAARDPLALALAAVARGRPEEARAQVRRLIESAKGGLPGQQADAYRHQAQIEFQLKNPAAAEAALERALAQVRDYGPALRMLTQVRFDQGRPAEALVFIERICVSTAASPSERADAGGRKAEIQLSLNDTIGAEESLARAQAVLPEHPRVLSALAQLRVAQGRRAEAAELAERLERAVSDATPLERANAFVRQAQIRSLLQDDGGAEKSLKRALEADPSHPMALEKLANLLLAQGRSAEALELSRRLIDRSTGAWPSRRAEAYRSMAAVQLSAKDYAGAERSLEQALEAAPNDVEARLLLARARLARGDASGARDSLRRALAEAPDSPDALRSLAEFELARGRPAEALGYAKRLVKAAATQGRRRAEAYQLLTHVQLALKDEAGAQDSLERALEAAPDDPETLRAFADLLLARGRAAEALPLAERLVAVSSGAAASRLADAQDQTARIQRALANDELLARAQLALKDDPGAQESLRRALAAAPKDSDALRGLAEFFLARSRPADALPFAERLVALSSAATPSRRSDAYQLMARVRLALKDEDGARDGLQRALAAAPDSPDALRALADMQLARGRPAEARAAAESLVALSTGARASRLAEADELLARAQLALKDDAGAQESLRRALAAAPKDSDALRGLAEFLLVRSRPADALPFAERLIAASSGTAPSRRADAYQLLARIRLALKDEGGARDAFQRALAAAPESPDALRGLAAVQLAGGRPGEARAAAESLVALSTGARTSRLAEANELLARAQLALKDDAGALISLRRAHAASPDDPDALRGLADILLARSSPAEALPFAERLVAVSSGAPPSRRSDAEQLRARAELALGDQAAAERSLRRALAAFPESPDALGALTDLLLARGRPSEALPLADDLVSLSTAARPSRRADAYEKKARVQLALKDEAGAQDSFQRALAAAPDNLDALRALADLTLARGRPAEARPLVDRLLAALRAAPAPQRAAAYQTRARVDLELKDLPAALSDLGHALETAPDDVATLGVLADAAGPEKALALIESHRPSEAGPRAPWLVLRGAARAQTKDADGALADFKAALALDARAACFGAGLPKRRDRIDPRYFDLCLERFPKDAGLHVDRGVALFEAGQRAGAEADFRRAAALDPGDERARQSLEALLNPRP